MKLNEYERDNAIERIAEDISIKLLDFGEGNRDYELVYGREIGEVAIDALESWGWTILPTTDE